MGMVYFIPNLREASDDDLLKAGLGHAFERLKRGAVVTQVGCQHGPAGGQGVLVTAGQGPISYAVGDVVESSEGRIVGTNQTWVKAVRFPWWMGWESAKLPTPAGLARSEQIKGENVELGDGNLWQMPKARAFDVDDSMVQYTLLLPPKLDFVASDDPASEIPGYSLTVVGVVDRYVELQRLSDRINDPPNEVRSNNVRMAELVIQCARVCLQTNYRVGVEEIRALGLIDLLVGDKIVRVLNDLDNADLWRQKKIDADLAGRSSSVGQEVSLPDTVQPAPT